MKTYCLLLTNLLSIIDEENMPMNLSIFTKRFYLYILLQQVVELNGYVIILVESRDGKIKLYGSPADKDNLEVADEILDINEKKLEDCSRAEVIKHIHEVILYLMLLLSHC